MEQWFSSFNEMMKQFQNSYETIKNQVKQEVQQELQQLEIAKQEWKTQQQQLSKTHFGPEEKVLLDVGGEYFTTSVQTLTSVPSSMLGAMFSVIHTVKKD